MSCNMNDGEIRLSYSNDSLLWSAGLCHMESWRQLLLWLVSVFRASRGNQKLDWKWQMTQTLKNLIPLTTPGKRLSVPLKLLFSGTHFSPPKKKKKNVKYSRPLNSLLGGKKPRTRIRNRNWKFKHYLKFSVSLVAACFHFCLPI